MRLIRLYNPETASSTLWLPHLLIFGLATKGLNSMPATYNGKPCLSCGSTERYKTSNQCAPCNRLRQHEYRTVNKDLIKKQGAKYRKDNHAKEHARHQKYREENRGKERERGRKYRKDNTEKCRLSSLRSKRANKEHSKQYNREWRLNNPDKTKAYTHHYRAKKRGAGGSYTAGEWRELCNKYDNRCLACGKKTKLAADHIIPVAHDGSSDISNIQPLCKSCNSSKGTKHTDYRTKGGILGWIQKRLF